LNFYLTAIQEILKRLPHNDIIIKELIFYNLKLRFIIKAETQLKI